MILRTVRALISLTVRAACKITTSNKPAKSHRDKSKQTNSSKDIYQYYSSTGNIHFCHLLSLPYVGNDSNLLIVFYVQIMPDDFVMQLHRF
ncbi:hypothetical protein A191_04036 [Escherichia coli KTE233]|nr:hypothetical protein A191_04036 [Escherichia coli KTE233]